MLYLNVVAHRAILRQTKVFSTHCETRVSPINDGLRRMKFFSATNNGVTAVISEEHAPLYKLIKDADGNPPKGGVVKVFAFHSSDEATLKHKKEFSFQYAHYVGSIDDLDWLIEQGGHELVLEAGWAWDGYVPFSNGNEIAETREQEYVTNLSDVRAVFFGGSSPQKNTLEVKAIMDVFDQEIP